MKNICKMIVLERVVVKRNVAVTALKQATKLYFHRRLIFNKMQGYLSAILSLKKITVTMHKQYHTEYHKLSSNVVCL